ncbi:MAG: hypothetical protein ABR936_09300 [Bacteroidota bacterium]
MHLVFWKYYLLTDIKNHSKNYTRASFITGTCFIIFSCCLFSSLKLYGQEKNYYFFRPYEYGSEALFNPISVFVNGGCDTYQQLSRSSTFDAIPWNKGATSVWRSVTSPLPVISDFGWNRFLRQEIFPASFDIDRSQWVPNYMLHVVGGGMVSRKIAEWYDFNGYPLPYLFGAITVMASEFLNEAVENGPHIYPNEDCIPDFLIFHPLGILLFSSDKVSEFFSSELNLNDWSQPAALSFAPLAFRNAGQNFVMKYALTKSKSTSLFFHFGNFAILGLSFKNNIEDAISMGAGLASTGVKSLPVQNGVPSNTIESGLMAGIYYDRNNSLLASMVYSASRNCRFRLNVYPGVISSSYFSPGFFITIADPGIFTAGVTMKILPLGVSTYDPVR